MVKRRLFVTSMLSLLTVVGGVSILMNSNTADSLISLGSHATVQTHSIEMTRKSATSYSESTSGTKYAKVGLETSNGNPIYLYQTGEYLPGSNNLAALGNSSYNNHIIQFFRDSDVSKQFCFQGISSLTLVTSRDIRINVQTSMDGIVFNNRGYIDASSSGGTFDGFNSRDRFIKLTTVMTSQSSGVAYLNKVVIEYYCDSSVGHVSFDDTKIYSAELINNDSEKTNASFDFSKNPEGTSFYYYKNTSDGVTYQTAFTWDYDEYTHLLSIHFKSNAGGTGDNAAYQGCRLFYSNSMTTGNGHNALLVEDNSVTIYLYSGTTYTTVWSAPTTFTAE